jgi:MFS family permease
MYLVMTVTPVFMHECHHDTVEISWVFFAHLLGMYGLSFVVGWLIDRLGRLTVIVSGSLVLAIAVILAPLDTGTPWLALVLFLVGLGWNCCFVSGSSLLSDLLRSGERGRIQGLVDTLVNTTAALASLGSGLLYAYGGFSIANSLSLFVALIPCLLVWKLAATFRRHPTNIEFIDPDCVD